MCRRAYLSRGASGLTRPRAVHSTTGSPLPRDPELSPDTMPFFKVHKREANRVPHLRGYNATTHSLLHFILQEPSIYL